MECNYERRLQELCRRKLEQTLAKKEHNGYMNEDDYGCVLPPENFHFEPELTIRSIIPFTARGCGEEIFGG